MITPHQSEESYSHLVKAETTLGEVESGNCLGFLDKGQGPLGVCPQGVS